MRCDAMSHKSTKRHDKQRSIQGRACTPSMAGSHRTFKVSGKGPGVQACIGEKSSKMATQQEDNSEFMPFSYLSTPLQALQALHTHTDPQSLRTIPDRLRLGSSSQLGNPLPPERRRVASADRIGSLKAPAEPERF